MQEDIHYGTMFLNDRWVVFQATKEKNAIDPQKEERSKPFTAKSRQDSKPAQSALKPVKYLFNLELILTASTQLPHLFVVRPHM